MKFMLTENCDRRLTVSPVPLARKRALPEEYARAQASYTIQGLNMLATTMFWRYCMNCIRLSLYQGHTRAHHLTQAKGQTHQR